MEAWSLGNVSEHPATIQYRSLELIETMKMFSRIAAFVYLFSAICFGQNTATITAHLADPGSTSVGSRTFVRTELKATGGQQCKVAGVALVTPYVRDFTPNATGDLSFLIYKNSVITCGNSTGNSQWAFTVWRDGSPQPSCFLQISGNTDLTSASCLNATSTPTVAQPTDAVYCRIDASNCGFTGNVTHNGHDDTGIGTLGAVTATISGNETVGGTLGVTGASTLNGGTINGSFSGNPTLSGNPVLSGTVTESGSTTVGKWNNLFILDGTKYTRDNAGLHSAATDCITQGGGHIVIPSAVFVTLTSQLTLGNNTTKPPCELTIQLGGGLIIGILGSTTDAILAGDSSGGYCAGLGAGIGAGNSGTTHCVQFGATATFQSLMAPLDRTGAQEAFYWYGGGILGNCSATIGSALFDVQGVFVGTRIEHFYTSNIPGKVVRIRPGTSVKIASDIVIDGNMDNSGCAGGQGISIESATASEVGNISVCGQSQHAGAGLPEINIDGASVAGGQGAHNIRFCKSFHVETVATPATAITIADASHVSFEDLPVSGPAGTTFLNISQTAANRTHDIEVKHLRMSVSWTNNINNAISGFATASDVDNYVFGNGAAGAGGVGLYVLDTVTEQLGRVISLGTAPTCAVTGAGASGTCTVFTGSSDTFGGFRIAAAGAGPAATGTATLTLSSGLGSHEAMCDVKPMATSTTWNARASFLMSNFSATAPAFNWDNNAAALVAGNNYDVSYQCVGQ
jgi:hypothetical protein